MVESSNAYAAKLRIPGQRQGGRSGFLLYFCIKNANGKTSPCIELLPLSHIRQDDVALPSDKNNMPMKKNCLMAVVLFALAAPAKAQVYKDTNRSVKSRVTELYGQARKGVKKAGKNVGDFFGLHHRGDSDEVEIDGVKYMPVYRVNLFRDDTEGLREICRKDFARRYARAQIVSVAIPQRSWTETAVKQRGKIIAYRRRAYCYVLAKDGTDGYINARYQFKSSREPGKAWVIPEGYWPRFERADAIPNVHFEKLKD